MLLTTLPHIFDPVLLGEYAHGLMLGTVRTAWMCHHASPACEEGTMLFPNKFNNHSYAK